MGLGPWVHDVLLNANAPLAAALLVGLLASLGPCPLATNVTALGYMTREFASPRRVVITCGLYTLGRTLAYGLLGIAVLATGVQVGRVSNSLQTLAEIALGPLLFVVGLVLLDIVHPTLNTGGMPLERLSHRLANRSGIGAFLLGILFALSFCPYSAALYFGVLIPLAFRSTSGIAIPFLFGIGTSVPVVVIGLPFAFGVMRFAVWLDLVARVERIVRRAAAYVFIGAGLFMFWNWVMASGS